MDSSLRIQLCPEPLALFQHGPARSTAGRVPTFDALFQIPYFRHVFFERRVERAQIGQREVRELAFALLGETDGATADVVRLAEGDLEGNVGGANEMSAQCGEVNCSDMLCFLGKKRASLTPLRTR